MLNAIDKAKSRKQTQRSERKNAPFDNRDKNIPPPKPSTPPNTPNFQKNSSQNNNSF